MYVDVPCWRTPYKTIVGDTNQLPLDNRHQSMVYNSTMKDRKERSGGLEDAVQAAGTLAELARKLGITAQAVGKWNEVPPERCLEVEAATGVSRHILRPDVYGPPPAAARKSKPRPPKLAARERARAAAA